MTIGRPGMRTAVRRVALAPAVAAAMAGIGCRGGAIPRRATSEAPAHAPEVAALPRLPDLRPVGDAEAFPAATPMLDAIASRDAAVRRAVATEAAPAPAQTSDDASGATNGASDGPTEVIPDAVDAAPSPTPPEPPPATPAEPPVAEPPRLVIPASAPAPEGTPEPDPAPPTTEAPARAEPPDDATAETSREAAPARDEPPGAPALAIVEARLCRKVSGFGKTEPPPGGRCRAGQAVLVYCEVEGLRVEEAEGEFRSRLAASLEVVPAAGGAPAWRVDLGAAEDRCPRRRRDFFVAYRVTLPASLPPGEYRLALAQTDLLSGSEARREIALTVGP